eukprot:gnl/TRDRNA2_/TRDRNA2_33922_c0_seq1.p1 gnl/TRDRNA2_/TRDRNA2_33922_c0~~gnl/TRDRNA2_/TRDRNA2_33922_c0_seq1.p1  ORF type:complete len:661 (-),score=107.08 gnl/TRDRNA2_/TRDRNA2_33922_c0_seq1:80-2062(-)
MGDQLEDHDRPLAERLRAAFGASAASESMQAAPAQAAAAEPSSRWSPRSLDQKLARKISMLCKRAQKEKVLHTDKPSKSSVARSRPPPDPADLARLADGELLNDTLLDFFLGHFQEKFGGSRVHTFSSLFFSRLGNGGWEKVRTWTRALRRERPEGIFARDFLLVPIHDANMVHWWLAVVCYPWAASSSSSSCRAGKQPQVIFLDSLSLGGGVPELESATADREAHALSLLQVYLACEWEACFPAATTGANGGRFVKEKLVGIRATPPVPQQTNGADCGLYLLEFAARLLEDPGALGALAAGSAELIVRPGLRQRWRQLGNDLAAAAAIGAPRAAAMAVAGAGAAARPVATPSRPAQLLRRRCVEEDSCEPTAQVDDNRVHGVGAEVSTATLAASTVFTSEMFSSDVAAAGKQAGSATSPQWLAPLGSLKRKRSKHGPATSKKASESCGAPAPRRRSDVVLSLSEGANRDLAGAERDGLRQLGAGFCEEKDAATATHVVINGPLRRTKRVMCAICRGQRLVGLSWLRASLRAGRWVEEKSYVPEEPETWKVDGLEMLDVRLRRARTNLLLRGYHVRILPSVSDFERAVVAEVVAAAGAKIFEEEAPAGQPLLLITGTSDHPVATTGTNKGMTTLPICTPDEIFQAAIEQKLPSCCMSSNQ